MAARELTFSSSASSSSSSTIRWNYDVFLSFRGIDTRKNFTDHLYNSLVQAGVHTFRDDEELDKGEEIGRSLPVAIEESRISIIIFSRNYASSTWCLRELVKILECRKKPIEQMVLPIFLDGANPSDIRKQAGSFAEAFNRHEERFEREVVEGWRLALTEAADLSGWNQNDVADGHESKLIQIVVKGVLSKLNIIPLEVAEYPVGIDSRVEEMMRLLFNSNFEGEHVKIVGICGMGGIGKTTITKAVYNQIYRSFEGSSFLEDVRENSKKRGLVHLQNQLLTDIIKQEIQLISNVSRGKELIKRRVGAKKVLVILDDVDGNDQLQALAGRPDWFGSGSRVIITSRDEHVLNVHKVNAIYKPKELDFHQSLQLFSNYAFGRDQPLGDYIELAKNVVCTTGGLPLALEVLGSFLFDKKRLNEWESALEKLKKIPHKEVQEKLKISYDALDDHEKEIFLNVACFFIGTYKEDVNYILDGCDLYSVIGIEVLIQKSLVKIGKNNELKMHDQLRDLGREIVRKESPDEPRKRSRLWSHEEALLVLKEHMGTTNIKGMILNSDQGEETESEEHHFTTESFIGLKNLRLLQIDGAHLVGDFKYFPSELRWFRWRRCPFEFIPTDFHPKKLAVLDLSLSKISQVWDMWHHNKLFAKLKVLNLSRCHFLTRTPQFSGLPNLEILILEYCSELVEVHESIGILKRLVLLNLTKCKKIVELPSSIHMLSSLQNLLLFDWSKLTKLPEELGSLVSLQELIASRTAIENLPDSIGLLKKLTKLDLNEAGSLMKLPDSLDKLESLTILELSETRVTELPNFHESLNKLVKINIGDCQLFRRVPYWIGIARNLVYLCLDRTIITELPNAIGLLENLEELNVSWCRKLVKLPDSMGKMKSLKYLRMEHASIVNLPDDFGELSNLRQLHLNGCRKLENLSKNFGNLSRLNVLYATNCNLSEGGIPSDIGKLSSLVYLELGGNSFNSLPASISDLSLLEQLHLQNCTRLQTLPELPSSLFKIDATNCISLERFPDVSNLKNLRTLFLANSTEVQNLPECVCSLAQADAIKCMPNSASLIQIFVQQGLFEHLRKLSFLGSHIPDCFIPVQFSQAQGKFISEKIQVSFAEVTQHGILTPDIEITGLIICFIFALKEVEVLEDEPFNNIEIEFMIQRDDKTISTSGIYPNDIPITCPDHDQIYMRLFQDKRDGFVHVLKDGDQIQVSIKPAAVLKGKMDVKKGGIYLIYDLKDDAATMRQSTYKRLADSFTSCGGFVGDGKSSKKELLDLNAVDFSASSSCSVEGEVDRLHMDGSKANGSDNDEQDLTLTPATLDSLNASSFNKCLDGDNDWDLLPPKPKKPKRDPPLT